MSAPQGNLQVYCPEPSTIQGVNDQGIIVVQIVFYPMSVPPQDSALHAAYRETLRRATALGYRVTLEPDLLNRLRSMGNACVEKFDRTRHGVI